MIVYFSGTGNSRYCAHMLAELLDDEAVDAFHFIRDGIAAELISGKPWVFAAPTYGWRLPRVFVDFIASGSFAGHSDAYFVMTCGSETGNAAPYNQALCREKGLRYRGTLPVVMPENYIALFDAPRTPQARQIIADARPVLTRGAACIRGGQDFPACPAGAVDRLKSSAVHWLFDRFVVHDGPFAASDACTGCGKCEKSCPLGNVQIQNGRPVWNGRCVHCMACICGCPVQAIEYGRASRGKPRYQCPPYEGGC